MNIARSVAREWQTDGYLKPGKIVGVRRPTTEESLAMPGIGKKGRVRGEVNRKLNYRSLGIVLGYWLNARRGPMVSHLRTALG